MTTTGPSRPAPVGPVAGGPGSARSALEAERDFLTRSLEDLEAEHAAGDLDDGDYRALRDDYIARTAVVLRALAGQPANGTTAGEPANGTTAGQPANGSTAGPTAGQPGGDASAPSAGTGARQANRARPGADQSRVPRRWVVGFAVVAFAVGAGLLVARLAGTRTSTAGLTGDVRASTATQLQRCLELASGALRADGAGSATSAQDAPGGGDGSGSAGTGSTGATSNALLSAVQCYSGVLQDQPSNAQALTYRGWLLVRTGNTQLVTAGVSDLDAAVRADPTYPDARAFRAIVFYRIGEAGAAQAELDVLDTLAAPPIIDQILSQFGVREGVADALRNASAPSTDSTSATTTSNR